MNIEAGVDNLSLQSFQRWTKGRDVASLGTNSGSKALPFQNWRNFKEAFAPELIYRAVTESPIKVRSCLDPFAGSGTTALACQFLGIKPITIEVNPYLADLVEAKLSTYNIQSITDDFGLLLRTANTLSSDALSIFSNTPPTFIEPGIKERWLFDRALAERLAAYRIALDSVTNLKNRRLLQVLLGGILVNVSNVFISGKGRRYRPKWQLSNRKNAYDLDEAFCKAVESAIDDIARYDERIQMDYTLLRGDSRLLVEEIEPIDLAIFSPPYPNSFDYTDVYNVELWALGYINSSASSCNLRSSTLSSHVQIKRQYSISPDGSNTLDTTLKELNNVRSILWNKSIPDMVGAYFADMYQIICSISERLPKNGQMWIVVGDSRYAGITIPVATILGELASSAKCNIIAVEPFRSMRASPQQGGDPSLAETLLILGKQ